MCQFIYHILSPWLFDLLMLRLECVQYLLLFLVLFEITGDDKTFFSFCERMGLV